MHRTEYDTMAGLEDTYWWHVGKNHIVHNQLQLHFDRTKSNAILNIGCGTGGTVSLLERFGTVTNVDTAPEAIAYLERRGIPGGILVNGIPLPFPDGYFELIAALDVLEHIENDAAVLTEWLRVLKPGGKLLLTVPAYQWPWTGHDESLHHYRRYTASGLHSLLNRVGFRVRKKSYAIVFPFPLIVGFRLLQSMFGRPQQTSYVLLPKPINALFVLLLRIEAKLLRYMNMPCGTSVLIIAQKESENRR